MTKRKLKKISRMNEKKFNKYLKEPGTRKDMKDIIDWFRAKGPLSSEKLTALCYFLYSWGMVLTRSQVAPFEFIKTDDGIVEANIDRVWKRGEKVYRSTMIRPKVGKDLEKLLNVTWNVYGDMDDISLIDEIKEHLPYVLAKPKLDPRDIYVFFSACTVA